MCSLVMKLIFLAVNNTCQLVLVTYVTCAKAQHNSINCLIFREIPLLNIQTTVAS